MYFLGFLVVGVVVGFLAGYVMTGPGYGIFWDMVVGAVGAMVAGLVLSLMFGTYSSGLVISYLGAVIAGAVLVAVLHVLVKERPQTARP
jgi:uncharacterized membrane protein YeaQ/YmgE (transglycosylase-associated protein family)